MTERKRPQLVKLIKIKPQPQTSTKPHNESKENQGLFNLQVTKVSNNKLSIADQKSNSSYMVTRVFDETQQNSQISDYLSSYVQNKVSFLVLMTGRSNAGKSFVLGLSGGQNNNTNVQNGIIHRTIRNLIMNKYNIQTISLTTIMYKPQLIKIKYFRQENQDESFTFIELIKQYISKEILKKTNINDNSSRIHYSIEITTRQNKFVFLDTCGSESIEQMGYPTLATTTANQSKQKKQKIELTIKINMDNFNLFNYLESKHQNKTKQSNNSALNNYIANFDKIDQLQKVLIYCCAQFINRRVKTDITRFSKFVDSKPLKVPNALYPNNKKKPKIQQINQIKQSPVQLTQLKKQLQQLNAEYCKSKIQVQQYEKLKVQFERLNRQNQSCKAKLQQLYKQLQKNANIKKQNVLLSNQINNLINQKNQQTKQKEQLRRWKQQYQSRKQQIQDSQIRFIELQKVIKKKIEDIQPTFNQTIQNMKQMYLDEIDKFQREINQQKANALNQINTLNSQLVSLNSQFQASKQKLDLIQKQRTSYFNQLNNSKKKYQQSVYRFNQQKRQLQRKINKLERIIQIHQNEDDEFLLDFIQMSDVSQICKGEKNSQYLRLSITNRTLSYNSNLKLSGMQKHQFDQRYGAAQMQSSVRNLVKTYVLKKISN